MGFIVYSVNTEVCLCKEGSVQGAGGLMVRRHAWVWYPWSWCPSLERGTNVLLQLGSALGEAQVLGKHGVAGMSGAGCWGGDGFVRVTGTNALRAEFSRLSNVGRAARLTLGRRSR